jgi:hypothetical protein
VYDYKVYPLACVAIFAEPPTQPKAKCHTSG